MGEEETKGVILSRKYPDAIEEDYRTIQGGMPRIIKEEGSEVVTLIHDYPKGEGMIVRGVLKGTTVTMNVEGKGPREFRAEYLKQYHGDPCERLSTSMGGKGYDRAPILTKTSGTRE